MPTVAEIRKDLEEKRAGLAAIFEKHPTLDFDETVAKEVKARNEELTELGKKFDDAREFEGIRDGVLKDIKGSKIPGTEIKLPGGDSETKAKKDVPSLGEMFVKSAAFLNYNKTEKKSPAVEINLDDYEGAEFKTLLDSTGWAPEATRTGRIVEGALRRPVVADLIPQTTTRSNAIVYMEETTTTNNAATVAEGAEKPESALAFTERTAPVRKIATVLPVTDELMEDEPAMRGYVEQRLRLFLQLAEETQLISGDGNAPNLTGIMNASNVQTQAKGADPVPDAVYKAMTLIQVNSFLDPTGVIFHPTDWQDVRLLRTTDGIYIWGSPSEPGPERIWGLPVVKTTAATLNTAIVAAFDTAMQIFRRNEVSFAVSDQHSDFFIKNKLMLRVEERLAFPIYRGAGICKVTSV